MSDSTNHNHEDNAANELGDTSFSDEEQTVIDALKEASGLEDALQNMSAFNEGSEGIEQISEPEKTKEDYEQVIAELNERALRAAAETENIRKRTHRELEESNKYAITGFARDLISVVENLNRAAANIPEEAQEKSPELKSIAVGVEMTLKELYHVFEKHNIKRVDPTGDMFNHNLHQAVVQIENDDEPAGTILQVMQAGYTIHDRLLQPAMVGVAKASNHDNNSGSDSERLDTEA